MPLALLLQVVLGAIAGSIGFVPLLLALKWTKRAPEVGVFGHMAKLMLGLVTSFVLMFALTMAAIFVDRSAGMPFVLAEVITLSAIAIAYGVRATRT